MSAEQLKVLVVGLDGATFDLMGPWMEDGTLPHLAGLLRRGSASPLRSTIPPITPCAWSSFMTGKNPGKHGLFDFVQPTADGRGIEFTNASFRDGETLWGILSRSGRSVGVVNVPMTYPPEKVNGYLISGLDTPHEHSPFMHPESIRKELSDASIRYRIDQQHLGNMRTDARRQRQINEIFAAETSRTDALLELSRRHPADFRMVVYGATDQVQHHFWHYMDPDHDKHDARGAAKFSGAIRDTYIHCDAMLGRLLEGCDEKTVIVVMSDHGFGPTTSVRLRLNQALEEAGLLTFKEKKSTGRATAAVGGWLDRVLRATLSSDAKRAIAGRFPKIRAWFENLDEAEIDRDRSVAYVNEAYRSSPALWLNAALAESDEAVLDKAEAVLTSLIDPQTGEPVISNVYRTSDLYSGQHAGEAPELLPSWWEDGFLLEQSAPGSGVPAVERSTAPIAGGVEFAGSHRLDGVFMIAGGPAKQGFGFSGASIVDVAPTILYLMGLPVPEDMDGRVLTECLEDHYIADHPIESVMGGDEQPEYDVNFTPEESELIAKRLQALGYIQ